jgi:hypothetical protein
VVGRERPTNVSGEGASPTDRRPAGRVARAAVGCRPVAYTGADGDREAPRILLGACRELTSDKIGIVNRLRALLLTGHDTDRMGLAPHLLTKVGIGQLVPRTPSCFGHTTVAAATTPPSPRSPAPAPSLPAAAGPSGTGLCRESPVVDLFRGSGLHVRARLVREGATDSALRVPGWDASCD